MGDAPAKTFEIKVATAKVASRVNEVATSVRMDGRAARHTK